MSRSPSALISMLPLDVVGGGERFTINACVAAGRGGDPADLWGAGRPLPPLAGHGERMQFPFHRLDCRRGGTAVLETVPLRELLRRQADYDLVQVHQHLANVASIDVLANASPWQRVLLTSHGAEPVADLFAKAFEPHAGVEAVEVSRYATERSRDRGIPARNVSAGIWDAEIAPPRPPLRLAGPLRALAVGRLLPHKGFEVAVDAVAGLGRSARLTVVGPSGGDAAYERHLRHRAAGAGNVRLAGYLPEADRRATIAACDVLLANSSHRFYCGKIVDQVELFGLVILEGLAAGLLPIASDIPAFREIAETLGLEAWLYPERDTAALRGLLAAAADLAAEGRAALVAEAVARMRAAYLWDDYWTRAAGRPAAAAAARRGRAA